MYVFDLAEGYRSHGTDSICKFCIWCVYWQKIFILFVNSAYGMCVGVGDHIGVLVKITGAGRIPSWWKEERKGRREEGKEEGREVGRQEGREGKGSGKGKRKGGRKLTFSVSHFRACSSLVDVEFSTQSKQGDYTHILYRLPSSVMKSLFYFLRWDISWPLFMWY